MSKRNPFQLDHIIEDRELEEIPNEVEEEWDEALIEGKDEKREVKTIKPLFNYKKFKWLFWGICIIFIVLIGRLFHMQVIAGDEFKRAAEENRYRIQIKKPVRGVIYDANKDILVRNIPSFDLMVVPADLPKTNEEREDVFKQIKEYIDISEEEYNNVIEKAEEFSYNQIVFKKNLERNQALFLETKLKDLPGIDIEVNSVRQYESEEFSHIIGYTGKITEEELKNNNDYQFNDWLGKSGLEYYYENELRGEPGKEQIEVDSKGKTKEIVAVDEPESGKDLVLTINRNLQENISNILLSNLKGYYTTRAVAVALNPKSGEILAMVSVPQYNNNLFANGILEEDYDELINDSDKPLFNRAVSGIYPPGSTIKPVVALAALEEGIVNENTIIEDTGSISVPHKYNPGIVYNFVGWNLSGLGPMNLFSAIAESSDIYFYVVGGGFEDRDGLGVDKLSEYYQKFNIGSKTEIDLPGEKEGLIPTPEWKEDNKGEQWYLGDTYHMAIGQGDVLATPLQVAIWTSTIASGGTLYKPHVVKKIINKDGSVKEIFPRSKKENFVNKRNIELVKRAMRETVISGSAKSLGSLSFSSAGKTGTAQHSGSDQNHAWYTAFAPYEDPEIVVTVLVEEGGEGSKVAVPIAGEIMDWYLNANE